MLGFVCTLKMKHSIQIIEGTNLSGLVDFTSFVFYLKA